MNNRIVLTLLWVLLFSWILVYPDELLAVSHNPEQFVTSIRGAKDEGEQIVHEFCASCHAVKPLIELGAPKIGQDSDWKSRVKLGLSVLLQHTDEGYKAMPARGGCFECTDYQLKLAIIAMLPKSALDIVLPNKKTSPSRKKHNIPDRDLN